MQPSNELATRCIGRYLIDLPTDLVMNSGGGQDIDGVRISLEPAAAEEYKKALARRTAELHAAFVSRDGVDYPALRREVPLLSGTDGILFDRAKLDGLAGRMARVLEVLAWRDGYILRAEVNGTDTNFPEDKDNEALHTHLKTDVAEKTQHILDVISRTSGRTDLKIPSQQGVCIVNGFVRGAPTSGESIDAVYQFAKIDNFFMRIATTSASRGKNTVLDRIEVTRPVIERSEGKILRKGKRDVAGMGGYEAAYSMLTDEDAARGRIMFDSFVFELNSTEGSARKPRLRVELNNGQVLSDDTDSEQGNIEQSTAVLKRAPLSTSDVEKLWEKIIPTIRVHPNAF